MKLFFKNTTIRSFFLFLFLSLLTIGAEAAVDPVVVELHYQNGVKFYNRGQYEKATEEFEKTLGLDPENQEAKGYLDKLKGLKGHEKIVDAKESKDSQVQRLYEEGKKLYGKHEYDAAIQVFNKVLEEKPIDDLASSYKERCEVMISRKFTKEKKIADNKRLKEQKAQYQRDLKEEKERKKQEHSEMLQRRKEIKEEHLKERAQKPPAGEQLSQKEAKIEAKKRAAQEKKAAQEEARQRRLEEKKALKEERQKAHEEKVDAAKERYRQKREAQQGKKLSSQAKKDIKQEKKDTRKVEKQEKTEQKKKVQQQRQENKEMFLKGVEAYSRKDYQNAIETFQGVIDAESKGDKIYTNSAKRLLTKANLRLKGVGEDLTVENK